MQEKEINVSRENKRVRSRLTKIPYTPLVYGIRDQRQKMGWDQGSQARDLGSQAVGSGSVVLRGDQGSSFPTENQIS